MKKIINLVMLIIYILLSFSLIFLLKDILSLKELMIIIIFLIVIVFLFTYLIKNNILLFLSYPCIFIVLLLLFTSNIKSNNIINFVSDVFTNTDTIDNYRIIVLKDKYKSLDELKNKKIGYTKDTIGFTNLELKFQSICYDSIESMIKDLNLEKIDAAIVLYDQFSSLEYNKYDIIYKLEFVENIIPVYNNLDTTNLIYVNAIDNYDSSDSTGKSDINIIIGINYYIDLPSKNAKDKMNHASIYGLSEAIKVLEKLFENKINYYIKIDFNSLKDLIDKLDGIDVISNYSFISSGVEFKEGLNKLNGDEALIFSRERKGLIGGDRTRGENQEKIIESIIKKILSNDKYFDVLNEIKTSIKTNIPESEMLKLIKNQITYNYKWNITKYFLEGFDDYKYTYSYKCCKLNVIVPDITSVNEAITLIEYLKTDGVFK